jgi:hypothetical protein
MENQRAELERLPASADEPSAKQDKPGEITYLLACLTAIISLAGSNIVPPLPGATKDLREDPATAAGAAASEGRADPRLRELRRQEVGAVAGGFEPALDSLFCRVAVSGVHRDVLGDGAPAVAEGGDALSGSASLLVRVVEEILPYHRVAVRAGGASQFRLFP